MTKLSYPVQSSSGVRTPRIPVVDDDPMNLKLLVNMLQPRGYEADEVTNSDGPDPLTATGIVADLLRLVTSTAPQSPPSERTQSAPGKTSRAG